MFFCIFLIMQDGYQNYNSLVDVSTITIGVNLRDLALIACFLQSVYLRLLSKYWLCYLFVTFLGESNILEYWLKFVILF